MEKNTITYLLWFLIFFIFPQDDTLWLLNGKRIVGTYLHEDSQYIYFAQSSPKKNTKKKILATSLEGVYSVVRTKENEEIIYYLPEPHERFSSADYKAYLLGLADAKERYFPYGIVAVGVIYNTLGGFIGARNFLVLLVPWTYTFFVYILPAPSKMNLWREPIPYPEYLYKRGFTFGVKQKRVIISLAIGLTFTTIGIIAGNYYRAIIGE